MGNWDVSKPHKDGEPCEELATKTCNKQIASKLEDTELARDSEETCNNKQVISKLVASEDTISRRAVHEAITRWAGSMSVLIALPTREVRPLLDSIHELPPVTPQPKTGHWIIISPTDMYCSECNEIEHLDTSRKFCAYCGTKMSENPIDSESEERA